MQGNQIQAATGEGEVSKNPGRKQGETHSWYHLSQQNERLKHKANKHVVPLSSPLPQRHFGPHPEVNKSNKTHITPGKEPNPEVIPLAPGEEIKACGLLPTQQP